ncbi:MAG: ADOP family duplicated permease [Vicinamibacterales bacterium]
MDTLLRHCRIAARMLARRPGLAAGRLLTVTIVVTAAASVFAVANATFLRPLPFPHAERLLRIYFQPPGTTAFGAANPLTPIEFERFRQQTRLFEGFEGIWQAERALAGDGEPEAVPAGRVSAGFFRVLGGAASLGRVFTEEEVASNATVAVIGHGLWLRRFGGDPSAVGRVLLVDGEPHVIVGVMPESFEPAFTPSAFWTPLSTRDAIARTALSSVQTIGLLRPEVTVAQGVAELGTIFDSLKAELPAVRTGWTARAIDLREAQYGARRPAILMLLAAVAALGLIAIANLANLTLADVMFRRSDFAVRAALGASRCELVAGEIVESLMLAAAGGGAGLAGAAWLVPLLLALDASNAGLTRHVTIDWRVALGAFGVAVVVMLAAVAVPILRLAGPALASDVTAGSRRAIGGRTARRVRIALVTAQTALALVLLSSGALVVNALQQSTRVRTGFDPANVVTAQLRLSARLFPDPVDRATFVDRVLERLRETPGVVNAGTTLNPFTLNGAFVTLVHIEGRPTPTGEGHTVQYRRVSPGYFHAMRIPMLNGRPFERRDWIGSPLVAIVSRGFARRFWPGEDPLGRRVRRGAAATDWATVVGVVDDVRDVALDQAPVDTIYTPYFQGSSPAAPVALVVRTAADPRAMIDTIKRAVWQVDAKQPLAHVITLDRFLAASLGPQRFRAILIAVCGAIGLLLAAIGTYGVTARSVVERTREVGIRLALGGGALDVWWTLAWGSLRAVIAGAVVGIAAATVAGGALAAILPEVRGPAWLFAALCGGILVVVGAAAALLAARRVIAVEPLRALRAD